MDQRVLCTNRNEGLMLELMQRLLVVSFSRDRRVCARGR